MTCLMLVLLLMLRLLKKEIVNFQTDYLQPGCSNLLISHQLGPTDRKFQKNVAPARPATAAVLSTND